MKTLHRNLSLPISMLPLSKPVPVPRKAKLQGPQVETLVEQPPLMAEAQSDLVQMMILILILLWM